MIIEHIDSLEKPELLPYRTLRRPADHRDQGIFVAEGAKVVHRLLQSEIELLSVLCSPERLPAVETLLRKRDVTVFLAPREVLETIVGFDLHQGIMAVAKVPASPPLDRFIAGLGSDAVLVALDGLANAENVGVVVRNCGALGVSAVLVGETSSSPYLRRAVRNSMGAVFRLPVFHTSDLAGAIRSVLVPHGFRTCAADPSGRTILADADLGGKICFVFGSEGTGLTAPVRAACGELIAIPMTNDVDSLNVASASAVILYELFRRRQRR
ncbi:MAG TPA: RNA methyltransferase [Bacteroidota bacterium]|nr:RNA methyltransferase [Bacteroidota bacterium]